MRSLATKPKSAAAGRSRPRFSPRPSFFGRRAIAGQAAFFDPAAVHAKLDGEEPQDELEREADIVADRVVAPARTGGAGVPVDAAGALEDDVQRKQVPSSEAGAASGHTRHSAGASVGGAALVPGVGRSLPGHTRSEMEASFGTDLSHVRIHDDDHAARLSSALHARAFTHGADVYFNRNEFWPGSPEGRHLLAHELTHVLQQQAAGKPPLVQRRTFTPGRPAHDHKPGHWAAVQSAARVKCLLTRDSIECVCAAASPATVLDVAMWAEMRDKPLARQHLDHYLSGGGTTLVEDAPLKWLFENDAKIRKKLAAAIAGADKGITAFWQGDYDKQDVRYAWGGVDRVDFEVDRSTKTVNVWFKDRYDFHPVGFGYANKGTGDHIVRKTNCVHAAAVELKSSGAADFWMQGEATVPLSLFKSSSAPGSGSGSTD